MKERESVNYYFAQTLKIAKSMKACGENVQESSIIAKILWSMTTKFNYVVCSIEESNNMEAMAINELQSSLLVHEQRMLLVVEEEQVLQAVTNEKSGRGRGREGVEDPSVAEVEKDSHSIRMTLNAINVTNLGTFNMSVPCGRRMPIMLKLRIRWNKRMSSC